MALPAMKTNSTHSALSTLFRRFHRDSRGSIAIIFALLTIPCLLAVGAAVDYSQANRVKATLDAYADAAVLAAVNQRAMQEDDEDAKSYALKTFDQQAKSVTDCNVGSTSMKVTTSGTSRSAEIDYTANVPTAFMSIVGIDSIPIHSTATASSAQPTYIDFYLLLDNSPSMGVAATPSDVSTMVNSTPDQCAFACHDTSTYPNDYYGLAKRLGVTMRIDVVRSATQQLMDTASGTETASQQYRMAIYDFGYSARQAGLKRIFKLSSNLSSAKSAANNIDLMSVPYQNYADDTNTDFDTAFDKINREISNPGDGSSRSSPQKILFFVSDGVADMTSTVCSEPTVTGHDPHTGQSYTRCQAPLTVSDCTALKNRGIKIAVLYTTYLALPTNGWYMAYIDPFNQGPYSPSVNSKIAQNMESCASPGLYFEVSPTDGISEAMTALFNKVLQEARITK